MRLNVHDYSGHPFQVQLSRYLARCGHEVLHNYSTQYVTGHGNLEVGPQDPQTLRIEGMQAGQPLLKYHPLGRTRFELSYAQTWQEQLDRENFDVVVACNVPLFALARMRRFFAARKQPWVFWHQDVYSLGIAGEAARRLPPTVARGVSRAAFRMERQQVRSASRVVAIGDNFVDQYRDWNLDTAHVEVIPNWAPIDELVPGERDNDWSRRMGLPTGPVRLLYAGTLGRKHNPLLLLTLLDQVRARGVDATLVVCSEGDGADDLAAASAGRPDVQILGFQPAADFSNVLSSADAVVALLEPDAARFSVPSKVLSYLSAGRPIVALVPADNPSALDVRDAGGFVGTPDRAGALAAADWVVSTNGVQGAWTTLGHRAREFAESRFDIERIGSRFETILAQAADPLRARGGSDATVIDLGARRVA